jgi:hypothetical protein
VWPVGAGVLCPKSSNRSSSVVVLGDLVSVSETRG